MHDERTGLTVVFNGEIYNHRELRELWRGAYEFRTASDTEVILAGFALEGAAAVDRFVGQFAFALFDPRDHSVWLVRDRVGICPLFYAKTALGWAFASEAKALFAGGHVAPALDLRGVHQCLQLWAPLAPRTCFKNVTSLPPGHLARLRGEEITLRRYWELPTANTSLGAPELEAEALAKFADVFVDSVRLTLRADVPVAAYLSGGLDSSTLCAVAQRELGGTLQTFSVAFERPEFDESAFQKHAAEALGTEHHVITIGHDEIANSLPDVVWHAEQVMVRSAPAPLFVLSDLVRAHGTKVVLTGEGADEFLWGYDLYKEAKIRAFWAKRPSSAWRPSLLARLYPYMPRMQRSSQQLLRPFFGIGLEDPDAPHFSHMPRWTSTAKASRLLSAKARAELDGHDPVLDVVAAMPPAVARAPLLARAQYIEAITLLSGYLLSAQGDRVLLGHSVEGRFPLLDHRLVEVASALPANLKMRALREKYALHRFARDWLPSALAERTKRPYRAPVAESLVGSHAPQWSRHLLEREAVDEAGVFDGDRVSKFVARAAARPADVSESDSMVLMGIASTQLLHASFVRTPASYQEGSVCIAVSA